MPPPWRRLAEEEASMRWINIALVVALLAATLIFAVQNFQNVTVSFLSFRITAPLALQVAVIYLLGMVTGGSAWSLIRWAVEGSKRP
jgi:putative membrane protein